MGLGLALPGADWRELGVVVRVTTPTHPFFAEDDEGDREGNDGDRLVDGASMSFGRRGCGGDVLDHPPELLGR
jgi:hypothetical protein